MLLSLEASSQQTDAIQRLKVMVNSSVKARHIVEYDLPCRFSQMGAESRPEETNAIRSVFPPTDDWLLCVLDTEDVSDGICIK